MAIQGKGGLQALDKPEKTCRRWRLQIRLGKDHVNGGYVRHTRVVYGTKSEARKELRDFIAELESGLKPNMSERTFKEYADAWKAEREATGYISANTIRKDGWYLGAVMPYIGNTRLRDIDADTVARLMVKVRTEGGKDGNGRSGTTCREIYTVLKHVLADAVSRKALPSNPCDGVKPPKLDTPEKEALTAKQAAELTEFLTDGTPDSHRTGILLALACGLRRGEVCALRWCDIDLEKRTLKVTGTISSDNAETTPPKSKASLRTLPLDEQTVTHLKAWRKVQGEGIEAVVSDTEGGHQNPSNLARWWRKWSKENGFGGFTIHQMRHTYATFLCANGVDLVTASRLMGQSGTSMLMKIYAHRTEENSVRAQDSVAGVIYGKFDTRLTHEEPGK